MRELANRRMLAAVPLADLVVMNPTHFAVALKYDDSKMAAPRVVAKGADLLAFKIRDLAKDAKVPVLQAPPLARALDAHTEVDQEIPRGCSPPWHRCWPGFTNCATPWPPAVAWPPSPPCRSARRHGPARQPVRTLGA